MAAPTLIPIRGDVSTHSGPLGIVKTYQPRTTEIEALYRRRGAAWDTRLNFEPRPRPHYHDAQGNFQYMVECCVCLMYQRREAFSPDKRKRNGLMSECKSCRAEYMRRIRKIA